MWIPVPDYTTMYTTGTYTLNGVTTKTRVYSKLRVRSADGYKSTTPGDDDGIREPDVLSDYDTDSEYYSILGYESTQGMADAIVKEYTATYNSIKRYKGFYIGRYELTGGTYNPTVKKGEPIFNNQNWYNLKKACTNVVSSSYAQSTMIYGNQWDEVMAWLKKTKFKGDEGKVDEDSRSWGNYSDNAGAGSTGSTSPRPSGYNEAWKANNIYDLAGNCEEYTQEAYSSNSRITRGGHIITNAGYSFYQASTRDENRAHYNGSNLTTSRPALYVK